MRGRGRGFTLVELMVVVALIGILASVAVPRFADMIRKANEGATRGKLGSIRSGLQLYSVDNEGNFPADLSPLTSPGSQYLTQAVPVFTIAHGASRVIALSAAFDGALDAGGLGYVNSGGEWGRVWIECTHTDSKGTVWTEY